MNTRNFFKNISHTDAAYLAGLNRWRRHHHTDAQTPQRKPAAGCHHLHAADLRGTRLASADLSYANLTDARMEGAVLAKTRFDNATWVDGRTCQSGSVGQCK